MTTLIMKLIADEHGQDLIEYALLAGFVSLVVVATVTNLGGAVNGIYTGLNTQVGLIPTP
jgi:pilus assembly protein Flp/PilA